MFLFDRRTITRSWLSHRPKDCGTFNDGKPSHARGEKSDGEQDIRINKASNEYCDKYCVFYKMFNYFLHALFHYNYLVFGFWHFPPILCQTMCFAAYMLLAVNLGLRCCYNATQSITDNLQYYLHDHTCKRPFIFSLIGILLPSISRYTFPLLFPRMHFYVRSYEYLAANSINNMLLIFS